MSNKNRLLIGIILILGGIPSFIPAIINIFTHSKTNTSILFIGSPLILAGLGQIIFVFILKLIAFHNNRLEQ